MRCVVSVFGFEFAFTNSHAFLDSQVLPFFVSTMSSYYSQLDNVLLRSTRSPMQASIALSEDDQRSFRTHDSTLHGKVCDVPAAGSVLPTSAAVSETVFSFTLCSIPMVFCVLASTTQRFTARCVTCPPRAPCSLCLLLSRKQYFRPVFVYLC